MQRLSTSLAALALCSSSLGAQMQATKERARPALLEQPAARSSALAPFKGLDQVKGAGIDLLFAPVRPMALRPASGLFYAVNAHNNTVVEYLGDELLRTICVPWGPVSLALWTADGPGETPLLLVVCRGSYTLACIELASGRIVRLIDLPAEPADILIHPQSGNAFISCQAEDSVVELHLATGQIVQRYPIPSRMPTFLALDGMDVLVAPMISGNNSINGNPGVFDLEDPAIAVQGLKDHDLFRITPGGGVTPVARDMGTVLFAMGKHPESGELWQLGTDAKNKDPKRRGEPALRGDFVANQISLARLVDGNVVEPFQVIDLDDTDRVEAGVQFDASRSVGQPYGLCFDGEGFAYVVGLLSSNVTQLSADGSFVREWNVGSIPRSILVDPAGERALVYCWGDNTLERYDLTSNTPVKLSTLSLGFDPTSSLEREGRKLFYDARFSMHGNASCASCHVETETDMLAWDLSNLPFDDKGPLITQTMKGISDLLPLHWRGERAQLVDFNGAFDGLLGGRELDTTPGSEFDQFEAFIFSLEQPANPGTHASRMLDPSPDANGGNAVSGQDIFFSTDPVQGVCSTCHALPTGTNSEPQRAVSNNQGIDRRAYVLVPSFNALWRKEQPTLDDVMLSTGMLEKRPTNGSGLLSNGASANMHEFLQQFFTLTAQEEFDLEAFFNQLDSGMAPAAHRSWLLNQATIDSVEAELNGYLMGEALKGNADIAVFGHMDKSAASSAMRWFWDRASSAFVAEDSLLPARQLHEFLSEARKGSASWVMLGMPVGRAERFAVDFDSDDLFNRDELRLGSDPERRDSDGDGFPDGHEARNAGSPLDPNVTPIDTSAPQIRSLKRIYHTSKVAKLQLETDEPTRVDASWSAATPSGSLSKNRFEKIHTLVLPGLRYGARYTARVTVTDLAGNSTSMDLPGSFKALGAVDGSAPVLRNVSLLTLQNSGGVLHVRMSGQGHAKAGGMPIFGTKLKARTFVNGVFSKSLSGTLAGSDGFTSLDIVESGLSVGDVVLVVVDSLGITPWNMPDTAPANRERSLIYDGTGL